MDLKQLNAENVKEKKVKRKNVVFVKEKEKLKKMKLLVFLILKMILNKEILLLKKIS